MNKPIKNKISALLFSGGLVGERTWPLTTWMKKIPNTSIWHWRKLVINITKSITHNLKRGVMIISTFSTEVFYIFCLKDYGYYTYHLHYYYKVCFPTQHICGFCMTPTMNTDHFPKQYYPVSLCNWDTVFSVL